MTLASNVTLVTVPSPFVVMTLTNVLCPGANDAG
jgi:hypothetical protein